MALERQSIEKKDFPIGRRGYDPEAVDAHLSALADEVDELKRSARRRSETLASAASDQVQAIVEAAETSAAGIQRQAEEDAREIRADADSAAQAAREQAAAQARDYVGKVSESTAVMSERLDAMESELSALIESLRTGSNRLSADLQLLEGNMAEVTQAVTPRRRFEPESDPAAVEQAPPTEERDLFEEQVEDYPTDLTAAYGEPLAEQEGAPALDPVEPSTAGTETASGQSLRTEPGDGSDDTEGARLIALNMALNGTSREETNRYLAENFQLPDRPGLLDEVYASVDA
ncbi:MAG: DivIVA domain-containing protein [Solirubrobacteraceae bacterium]